MLERIKNWTRMNPSKIRVLTSHEIQLIAAGEVVERPAHVVKELVENAIDAGATEITLYVEGGGHDLIRCIDTGYGMSRENALLAIQHHATSKFVSIDTLSASTTFGFRGEALSSISAVSTFTLATRSVEHEVGVRIQLEGGAIVLDETVSLPVGTDISVRTIFGLIPARRKFLRKKETEWRAIVLVFSALAMSHTHVAFSLYHDGNLYLRCNANQPLSERVASIFGTGFGSTMIIGQPSGEIIKELIVSAPTYQRYDRSSIYLFINDRFVKNSSLVSAFVKGYAHLLPPGKYPTGIARLRIDPADIDINVHPRKEEILLRHPHLVEHALENAVQQALQTQIRQSPLQNQTAYNAQENICSQSPLYKSDTDIIQYTQAQSYAPLPSQGSWHNQLVPPDTRTPLLYQVNTQKQEHQQHNESMYQERIVPQQTYRYIGRLFNTYILIERNDEFLLIDQHTAAERVLYEKFMHQCDTIESLHLIIPDCIDLPQELISSLIEHQHVFEKFGFSYRALSLERLVIQAIPGELKKVKLADFFMDLASHISGYTTKEIQPQDIIEKIRHAFCSIAACKAAIKAGDDISTYQAQELISQWIELPILNSCPHGRPTSLVLNQRELERLFRRIA
ncbi:MAG: mismatch repair protein MutL protein [candidate division TM6 bacterium GW2011_GWE2_41_16]|nr:MAG: mismatch repair protein MutL protein [candidate division TM6 bacterium GW2011_GWE2_41_16]